MDHTDEGTWDWDFFRCFLDITASLCRLQYLRRVSDVVSGVQLQFAIFDLQVDRIEGVHDWHVPPRVRHVVADVATCKRKPVPSPFFYSFYTRAMEGLKYTTNGHTHTQAEIGKKT